MLRLVVIGGLVAIAVWFVSYRGAGPVARKRHRRALWVVLAVGIVLLLSRVGMHWLAAAGAAGLAVLRVLAPWLLRALPFVAQRFGPRPSVTGNRPGDGRDGGESGRRSAPPRAGHMTRAQALEVLGLQAGATRDEITAQYRKLIRELHPDQGGSQFLTRQLNQARDVLLRG